MDNGKQAQEGLQEKLQEELQEELQQLNKRLDSIERSLRDHKNRSRGNSIWVLVPVAAIVMWGLTQIFH